MKHLFVFMLVLSASMMACRNNKTSPEATEKPYQLITLDPGHFHAALVQKSMYDDVDSVVHVYGPEGSDLQMHLDRIDGYNTRSEMPTHWKEEVYKGADFFDKMIAEKKGNIVVLAGNNQKKTEYILRSLQEGMNVLADKPMVIDSKGFDQLKKAFDLAQTNKLLLYDIMTERFEINTILQREFSQVPAIFGTLEKGTLVSPAITKESVHHFYKHVSGAVLTRPGWFLDVKQQGEGIVDVMTHLVDLVQWECFPEQAIDYTKDIQVNTAKRWATNMSHNDFVTITKWEDASGRLYPSYLDSAVKPDGSLDVYCNGEINYTIKGIHAKTSVIWKYKAPEGTGDTHYSIMRGTKANLIIRQGKEENYQPTLYIEPVKTDAEYEATVMKESKTVFDKYKGGELLKTAKGWKVVLPDALKEGHEAHFARVMQNFLQYLKNGNMPAWEIPNMIAKYYTTIQGLELALKTK